MEYRACSIGTHAYVRTTRVLRTRVHTYVLYTCGTYVLRTSVVRTYSCDVSILSVAGLAIVSGGSGEAVPADAQLPTPLAYLQGGSATSQLPMSNAAPAGERAYVVLEFSVFTVSRFPFGESKAFSASHASAAATLCRGCGRRPEDSVRGATAAHTTTTTTTAAALRPGLDDATVHNVDVLVELDLTHHLGWRGGGWVCRWVGALDSGFARTQGRPGRTQSATGKLSPRNPQAYLAQCTARDKRAGQRVLQAVARNGVPACWIWWWWWGGGVVVVVVVVVVVATAAMGGGGGGGGRGGVVVWW